MTTEEHRVRRGIGSHSVFNTGNNAAEYEYKMCLQEDAELKTCTVLPIADFLFLVLDLHKLDWERGTAKYEKYKGITECNDYKQTIKVHANQDERDRYHPFATLIQTILNQLHRNDSKVHHDGPNVFGRGDRGSLSKSSPTQGLAFFAFHRTETLLFFELKAERPSLLLPSQMKENLNATTVHSQTNGDTPLAKASPNTSQKAVDAQSSERVGSIMKVIRRYADRGSRIMMRSVTRGELARGGGKRDSNGVQHEVSSRSSQGMTKTRSNEVRTFRSKTLNRDQTKIREDYLVQCTSYALDMLSQDRSRSHVMGMLVMDDMLELLYYARSVHFRSEPFNPQTDPITLIGVLDAMVKLEFTNWEYNAKQQALGSQHANLGATDSSVQKWFRPLAVNFGYGYKTREELESRRLRDKKGVHDHRKIYVIVQEKLFRVKNLVRDGKAEEFGQSVRDISKCYQRVYENGYLHRDISVGNMMYRRRDGKISGVLIDFDLAIPCEEKGGSKSKERTGTLPYMAYELLARNPPVHMYRHDLESIFYCIMDMTLANVEVHEGSRKRMEAALWEWHLAWRGELRREKEDFLFGIEYEPRVKPGCRRWSKAISNFRIMFADGYDDIQYYKRRRPNAKFDVYTCNRRVTLEKFHRILNSI